MKTANRKIIIFPSGTDIGTDTECAMCMLLRSKKLKRLQFHLMYLPCFTHYWNKVQNPHMSGM